MASRFHMLAVLAILCGLCLPRTAAADPIVVTGGQAVIAWDDPSRFRLVGEGLDLVSLFPPTPDISAQRVCDTGCAPGSSVPMRAVFGGSATAALGLAIQATVDGVAYTNASLPPESWPMLGGTLEFDGPAFMLPLVADVGGRRTVATAPFLFQGHITGFPRDNPLVSLFDVDLVGRGTASFSLTFADGLFQTPEVTFQFEPSAPIPEPAAVVLTATGLAGVVARRRRRARA